MKPVQQAKAPWGDVVFVCRKCARKAGAKDFRKEMKRALKAVGGAGRIRVVETGCLDLCPKRRIVLAHGALLAERRLLVVSPGAAGQAAALLAGGGAKSRLSASPPRPSGQDDR